MSDRSIPISRIVATLMWLAVVLLLGGAWLAHHFNNGDEAVLIGISAGVMSAGAATSQIRCYMLRVCALVNAYGGAELPRSGPYSLR